MRVGKGSCGDGDRAGGWQGRGGGAQRKDGDGRREKRQDGQKGEQRAWLGQGSAMGYKRWRSYQGTFDVVSLAKFTGDGPRVVAASTGPGSLASFASEGRVEYGSE